MSGSHLALMVWLSPAFPVGAFAYSHGLEWAHEAGDLADAASLEDWLGSLLAFGSARNDAILFAAAYRAPGDGAPEGSVVRAGRLSGRGRGRGGWPRNPARASPGGVRT